MEKYFEILDFGLYGQFFSLTLTFRPTNCTGQVRIVVVETWGTYNCEPWALTEYCPWFI